MFSNALCSVFLYHFLFCLPTAKSVVSSVSDKSVLNVVDAAFRQEAYLNEQISNSLHATQMVGTPTSSGPSNPLLPSTSDEELESPLDPSSAAPVLSPLESSEQPALASKEASPGIRFRQSPKAMLQSTRSLPSPAQNPRESHAHLGNRLNLASEDEEEEDTQQAGGHIATIVGADIRSMRPGAGSGVADIISFGVFAKALYEVDLKNNKFTMDSILALKWKDPRVASLVPAGMTELSMSGKEALAKIWMPEVVITNRHIKKVDVISTGVTIFPTGEVVKVERAIVVCNNVYELEEYPFDKQQLAIKIASSKYMLNDVVLTPDVDKTTSGARDGFLAATPYTMDSWRVFAFDDVDGALKKSRGVLELTVGRKLSPYWENHMKPTFMLLMISWGVFWFPFENPFITPRLALSILALLAFTNLLIKSTSALPDGSPSNWNDLFNLQIQAMMFLTIVLNIFSETCKHKLKLVALADGINNEAKVVQPCLSTVLITIVMTAGYYKWISLGVAGVVTTVLFGTVVGLYIAHNATRVVSHQDEQREKERQAKEAAAAAAAADAAAAAAAAAAAEGAAKV